VLEHKLHVKAGSNDKFDCTQAGTEEVKTIDVEEVRNQRADYGNFNVSDQCTLRTAFYITACPRKSKHSEEINVKLCKSDDLISKLKKGKSKLRDVADCYLLSLLGFKSKFRKTKCTARCSRWLATYRTELVVKHAGTCGEQ
jgi:hypothetical protein